MNIYFSNTYSDDEGTAEEAKSAMIFGSKEEILNICEFFTKVKDSIQNNDNCHMHLRDEFDGWIKGKDFDIEVTLD